MEEHIHLFVELPTTLSIAELMKNLKGTSSHFVNDKLQPHDIFKWQGNYSAFTVSRWGVKKVIDYIQKQKEHDANGKTITVLEYTHENSE